MHCYQFSIVRWEKYAIESATFSLIAFSFQKADAKKVFHILQILICIQINFYAFDRNVANNLTQ